MNHRAAQARRAASTLEYVLILAVFSLALLGGVTLFGRRVSRLWYAALRSTHEGQPVDTRLKYPTRPLAEVKPFDQPPAGPLNVHSRPGDYFKDYESLIGERDERLDDVTGALPAYADLPQAFDLPNNLDEAADAAQRRTEGSSNGRQEHGGTLVRDADGHVDVVNPGAGGTDGFSRNPTAPAGTQTVGSFHTHGDDTTFSDQDMASLFSFDQDLQVKVLQNVKERWALVRTRDTHAAGKNGRTASEAARDALNEVMSTYCNPNVHPYATTEMLEAAAEAALAKVAAEYKLGLYRGGSRGPLQRVGTPPPPPESEKWTGQPDIPDGDKRPE